MHFFILKQIAKDPWIAYGLIDYYAQTNSYRIVEVLVKVQTPHDVNIFNKLSKCLADRESTINRTTALTLFGHIVRKHPTWLYKVVNHPFMKDLLKLLKVSRCKNAKKNKIIKKRTTTNKYCCCCCLLFFYFLFFT